MMGLFFVGGLVLVGSDTELLFLLFVVVAVVVCGCCSSIIQGRTI